MPSVRPCRSWKYVQGYRVHFLFGFWDRFVTKRPAFTSVVACIRQQYRASEQSESNLVSAYANLLPVVEQYVRLISETCIGILCMR
jgi:hypothetical protein